VPATAAPAAAIPRFRSQSGNHYSSATSFLIRGNPSAARES
jgi:hypothetical protein